MTTQPVPSDSGPDALSAVAGALILHAHDKEATQHLLDLANEPDLQEELDGDHATPDPDDAVLDPAARARVQEWVMQKTFHEMDRRRGLTESVGIDEARPGLTQKVVTVKRGGKEFERKQWVRTQDKPAVDKPAKVAAPTIDHVRAHLASVASLPHDADFAAHATQLADMLQHMTVKNLADLNRELGTRAGAGKKVEVAKKIAKNAIASIQKKAAGGDAAPVAKPAKAKKAPATAPVAQAAPAPHEMSPEQYLSAQGLQDAPDAVKQAALAVHAYHVEKAKPKTEPREKIELTDPGDDQPAPATPAAATPTSTMTSDDAVDKIKDAYKNASGASGQHGARATAQKIINSLDPQTRSEVEDKLNLGARADDGSYHNLDDRVAMALIQKPVVKSEAPKPATPTVPPSAAKLANANEKLPDHARPALSPPEAKALNRYIHGDAYELNASILDGREPTLQKGSGTEKSTDSGLQAAFAKVQDFPTPVEVHRTINASPEVREKMAAAAAKSLKDGSDFSMPGYLSTTTDKDLTPFGHNVVFQIKAKNGLDMSPYADKGSEESQQRELLLNKESKFKVTAVENKGGKLVVSLDQMASPATPTAPTAPPPAHVQAVGAATKALGGEHNLASMVKVRQHLAQQGITDRAAQDAAIGAARKAGLVTGAGLEGRQGITPEEKAAAIPGENGEHGIGYLSSKEPAVAAKTAEKPVAKPATSKPAPAYQVGEDRNSQAHESRVATANALSPGQRGGPGSPLRGILRDQVQYMKQLVDGEGFQSVPDLYRRAKEEIPNLTPEEFKAEIVAATQDREGPEGQLQLHILNEVREKENPKSKVYDPHGVIPVVNGNHLAFTMWDDPKAGAGQAQPAATKAETSAAKKKAK